MSSLSQSQYTTRSTKDFIETIHNANVPHGFHMTSFDVIFLFQSVLLEETITVALDRIYHRKEIGASICKYDMCYLLLLCTKIVDLYLLVAYINKMMMQAWISPYVKMFLFWRVLTFRRPFNRIRNFD